MKKTFSTLVLVLLLGGMLFCTLKIQPVKADGTIYIRADGSIDPPTAPISTVDNVTYTLTANISSNADGIAVKRSNIIIDGAGYAITSPSTSDYTGIDLSDMINVTIKNTNVKHFHYGIWLAKSSSNSSVYGNNITDNNITDNGWGIYLFTDCNNNSIHGNNIADNNVGIGKYPGSSYNNVSDNNITANNYYGIFFLDFRGSGSNNSISGNNITANVHAGIMFTRSDNNSVYGNVFFGDGLYVRASYGNVVVDNLVNGKPLVYLENVSDLKVEDAGQVILVNCNVITVENLNLSHTDVGIQLLKTNNTEIYGNNITDNDVGVFLCESSNNVIYHNNLIDNNRQVYDFSWDGGVSPSTNVWDDGYPSGGNYWSDYNGTDLFKGPEQNEPGSDCIGDTNYTLDAANIDRYPLINPYGSPPPPFYSLTITSSSTVGGTINPPLGTYEYSQGQTVPVRANPHTGYRLDYWELDSVNVGSANPYSVTMDQNHTLKAVFEKIPGLISDIAITNVSAFRGRTVLFQGFSANVTVTVENHGGYFETFNVTVYANMTATANVTKIGKLVNVALNSGSSASLTCMWNATGFAKWNATTGFGNYTLIACADPVPEETHIEDNNFTDGCMLVTMVGDLVGKTGVPDGTCSTLDISVAAKCFGGYPGCPPPLMWNVNCDVTGITLIPDDKIGIIDISVVAKQFGKSDP